MTKPSDEEKTIKLAVVSDIHLGHKRNTASSIIAALKKAFPFDETSGELDIIFLAGDVFDRLLELPQDAVVEIQLWVAYMIELCSKYSIKLRVLEGTASHDWKQSELFMTVARALAKPIDLQYVKTLHIEYMEDFDLNILYMPDDLPIGPENTLKEAKELIAAKGLSQVDLGIFHGNFEYQLPAAAKNAPRHDSSEYLRLVKKLIFIGHIHTASNLDRIYAQGSFDRLSHGEEEAKGHIRAQLYPDDSYQVQFVENKMARRYWSYDCANKSLPEVLEAMAYVETLPDDSCVRLTGPANHPALADMSVFLRLYPTMVWSKLVKDKESEQKESEDQAALDLTYTPIHIDRHNVEALLMERVKAGIVDPRIVDSARTNLLELI